MTNQATIGIDLWHAVEFSRYGCALNLRISPNFQGRPPNLVHACRLGQTGLNEVLDLAEAQFLELLCLLSGLNRPFPARSVTIHRRDGAVKSTLPKSRLCDKYRRNANYPRPLAFWGPFRAIRLIRRQRDLAYLFAKPHIFRIKSRFLRV
jgi:hypothetical protein